MLAQPPVLFLEKGTGKRAGGTKQENRRLRKCLGANEMR